MSTPAPLNDDDREDLVAYLDGELTEDDARRLESKLSLDPAVRAEADSLKRTWDLLDFLPRPEPSSDFTQKTLTRLNARETRSLLNQARRWRRWLLRAGWAAAVLVAALGGYAATYWLVAAPAQDKELVRDLRLIENLRLYEQGESLEFLRDLDHPDLFGDNLDS